MHLYSNINIIQLMSKKKISYNFVLRKTRIKQPTKRFCDSVLICCPCESKRQNSWHVFYRLLHVWILFVYKLDHVVLYSCSSHLFCLTIFFTPTYKTPVWLLFNLFFILILQNWFSIFHLRKIVYILLIQMGNLFFICTVGKFIIVSSSAIHLHIIITNKFSNKSLYIGILL